VFRTAMRELGWVMQVFCDWRLMEVMVPTFREIAREMPVIIDQNISVILANKINNLNRLYGLR
jgi:2-pyrone-4,6-dicarboxylate lactonase